MMTQGHLRTSALVRLAFASVGLSLLAGCAGGGLASFPALPSPSGTFSADAADGPSAVRSASDHTGAGDLMQPGGLEDKAIGKPNAPVTIIQYVSLSCMNCNKFQADAFPRLKKAYIDTGKVRFILREFPIGRMANNAALAARCAPGKDYFKVTDKLLTSQKDWLVPESQEDELYNAVKFTGLSRKKFDACLKDQSLSDSVAAVKQRGRAFGVAGTPTFFVNGTKIAGAVSFEEMQSVVETALAAGQSQVQQHQPDQPRQQASLGALR
jgi:protein-disulfide isomerase